MPEIRFQVEYFEMLRKTVSDTSGTRCFQIVDQGGDIECRVDLRQKMHLSEFQQSASPILKDFAKGLMQIVEKLRGESGIL